VQVTEDGGGSWKNVTTNIPGLLPWGTISNIEPSRFDAATAYLTVDGHQENNRDPWIYKTTDYGASWTAITAGMPHTPLSYVHVVKEDPVRRGLLYAGAENGLYVSFDDGAHWQPLQTNLPTPRCTASRSRSISAISRSRPTGAGCDDDISPLRQLTPPATMRSCSRTRPTGSAVSKRPPASTIRWWEDPPPAPPSITGQGGNEGHRQARDPDGSGAVVRSSRRQKPRAQPGLVEPRVRIPKQAKIGTHRATRPASPFLPKGAIRPKWGR
jgi:hypothetical protein